MCCSRAAREDSDTSVERGTKGTRGRRAPLLRTLFPPAVHGAGPAASHRLSELLALSDSTIIWLPVMELQHLVHASDVHSIREEIRKVRRVHAPVLFFHLAFCARTRANFNALQETLDIYNRLQSVNEDIAFLTRVHTEYPNLPLMRSCPSVDSGMCA
jgi:hypothetical protein